MWRAYLFCKLVSRVVEAAVGCIGSAATQQRLRGVEVDALGRVRLEEMIRTSHGQVERRLK